MRWHIIRILLCKEMLRQASNRGNIALVALLMVAALLLTFFKGHGSQAGELPGGVGTCFIDYWQEADWVRHLQANVPPELADQVQFRHVSQATRSGELLVYPPFSGAIQIRNDPAQDAKGRNRIWIWYSDSDGAAMVPYELWFWRESALYFQSQAAAQPNNEMSSLVNAPTGNTPGLPQVEHEHDAGTRLSADHARMHLKGAFEMGTSVTASLVLFALFFSCVYLMPSLLCEERERGVLLAQALSPASPAEILAAKFLFYPALGIVLAGVLAGIWKPGALLHPFFWLTLVVISIGTMGIGLTIACLARTQRTASMGALCYMLVVALFLYLCQQTAIPELSYVALEYHGPRMLHAVLADEVLWQHWGHLVAAAVLASLWCIFACALFRRRGWQ